MSEAASKEAEWKLVNSVGSNGVRYGDMAFTVPAYEFDTTIELRQEIDEDGTPLPRYRLDVTLTEFGEQTKQEVLILGEMLPTVAWMLRKAVDEEWGKEHMLEVERLMEEAGDK